VAVGQEVDAIALDELITEHTDLLKLNIEGAEIEALEGTDNALQLVKIAIIQYHCFKGETNKLPELLALLGGNGFDRFEVFECKEWEDPLYARSCTVKAWHSSREQK